MRPRIALQLAHGRLVTKAPSGLYCPDHGDTSPDFGEWFDSLCPRFISHNSNVGGPEFYDGRASMFVTGSHSEATIREANCLSQAEEVS